MELAKVTSKGQVTIPIEIRKKLGIEYKIMVWDSLNNMKPILRALNNHNRWSYVQQKKIYVNVLIVGAVILLYICINGNFQIEKGINMRHILELWNGYCNLIFYVKGNLFYLNEPLSDKTYIMHGTLNACLSWLMTGAGAVRYLNK